MCRITVKTGFVYRTYLLNVRISLEPGAVMDLTESLILPTPDELNRIYHELGTSEEKVKDDVKTIAEWMRKQPHFHKIKGNSITVSTCHTHVVETRKTRVYSLDSFAVAKSPEINTKITRTTRDRIFSFSFVFERERENKS